MNHTVSYPHSFFNIDIKNGGTHELYDIVLAAITDINHTVPSSRKIFLRVNHEEDICALHICQKEVILGVYQIDKYPHLIRRIWSSITVGFVDSHDVENIKHEILKNYIYGERAID